MNEGPRQFIDVYTSKQNETGSWKILCLISHLSNSSSYHRHVLFFLKVAFFFKGSRSISTDIERFQKHIK